MINETLDFPEYIKLDEVKKHSYFISKYMNEKLIENMRLLYSNDKNAFNQFRKELHLRGIGFKKELQNNFLNGISYSLYPYIIVDDEMDRYKKFPFDLFGLNQLVVDLKIESDSFFNYIPIHGFDKYIPFEKKELFILKLQEYGFQLVYENNSIYKVNKNNGQSMEKIIPQNEFLHFIKYCKNNGMNDINNIKEALKGYKSAKGTRKKIYKKLYNYCIHNKLIITEKKNQQNLYNYELKILLEEHGYDFSDFMDKYFSEDNLLLDKPYLYGQKIIRKIHKNNEVKTEKYVQDIENKLTKLQNHVNYKFIEKLEVSNIMNHYNLSNIFNYEDRSVMELGSEIYDREIIEILIEFENSLPNITEPKNEILNNIFDREYNILLKRNNGDTLEKIAKGLNVTRERVRQIESKAKRKLNESDKLTSIVDFVLFKYKNKPIIQIADFIKHTNLDVEDYFIIPILLEKKSNYLVFKEYKLIVEKDEYNKIYHEIEWYYSNDYAVIELNELKSINEENMELSIKLFKDFNYKLVNNSFVKSKISIVASIEYILSFYSEEIFINNKEDYEKLKVRIKKTFDMEINSNQRSLFSRVDDAENVILVDRNSYKYEDFYDIDGDFLLKLNQIINEELGNGPYANPRLLYKNHPGLMKENKVYSYTHLYSIIKNFFFDEYNIGYQNTLHIYPKSSKTFKAEDILITYLADGLPINILTILNDLNWKKIKLEQIIPRLSNVIINGKQEVVLIEGIEREQYYEKLYELINTEIEKGYLLTNDVFIKVIFDSKFASLLNKYHINDLQSFAQFVKSKFMHMNGFNQFLFSKHSDYKTLEDIIPYELPKVFTNKDLQQYIVEKGYSGQRYYKAKEILIENNKIIPYNNEIFLNGEKFEFFPNIEREITEFLNNEITEKLFITRNQLQKLDVDLDETLTVTPEIMTYIAKNNEYTVHEAYYGSIYELPIITTGNFDSYTEIVYSVVRKDFDYIYNEENLLMFLKSYGLVNENADKIYSTIKESDYFNFDNIGFFELNERGEENV